MFTHNEKVLNTILGLVDAQFFKSTSEAPNGMDFGLLLPELDTLVITYQ